MLFCLISGLSFLLSCHQAHVHSQTYAVVVGISDYQALSYATGDLRFADRDAQQVVAFLQSKAGGNVPASNIRLLINQKASQRNIKQALTVFQQAKPEDRIIFYFSGHGLPDSFVPYDAHPGDGQKMITHLDIKGAFHDSRASTKLCIADACLSGSMTKSQTPINKLAQLAARNFSEHNVAMMLASRSTQNAIEHGKLAGGVFTFFMLKGLSGKGDLDDNQVVTIRELHQYVVTRVKALTRGRQTPIFYGRFSDDLALAYL